MRFEDLYPHTPANTVVNNEDQLLCKADMSRPCLSCLEPTLWRDGSWGVEVPTCSEECQKQQWDEYWAAEVRAVFAEEPGPSKSVED